MNTLENILERGTKRAQAHFVGLSLCFENSLPEVLRQALPKSIDDLGGLFSASTKQIYLTVFDKMPGFEPLSAIFDYTNGVWALTEFSIILGGHTFLGGGKKFSMATVEDAAVVSKHIAAIHSKQDLEASTAIGIGDAPASKIVM